MEENQIQEYRKIINLIKNQYEIDKIIKPMWLSDAIFNYPFCRIIKGQCNKCLWMLLYKRTCHYVNFNRIIGDKDEECFTKRHTTIFKEMENYLDCFEIYFRTKHAINNHRE